MPLRILIAAGGTGGHIFPALALGHAIRSGFPEAEVDFLCGRRDLEQSIYRQAGENPVSYPASYSRGGVLGLIRAGSSATANLWRTLRLVRHMDIAAVVGMGGYVAGPAVLAGVLSGRKTVVHEANRVVGRTNRYLARWVNLFAVHFAETLRDVPHRNGVRVGMPIRADIGTGSREEAMAAFGLDGARMTLLVIGGSQGARNLYEMLVRALPVLDQPAHADLQVLWSTGEANHGALEEAVGRLGLRHLRVVLRPFINEMPQALAAADVALARAGASTLAELVSCGVRPLFVPFPAAIYDHQTRNAEVVKAAGLGDLIAEKDLTPAVLAERLGRLVEEVRRNGRARQEPPADIDSRRAAADLGRLVYELATGGSG